MAFCNACGANLVAGAQVCPKCGAGVRGAAPTPAPTPPATAPTQTGAAPQGNSALRIVLIVVAVVVVLGIVAIGSMVFIGLRIARHTHVHQNGDNVRVETPFGTVQSTNNPDEVARNLGVDIYPGAQILKGNSANMDIAGVHTVAAEFETDDPPDKVADFYKSKFPNATVSSHDEGRYSIVSNQHNNLVTITIDSRGDKTRIHIANVSGKGVTGGD